MKELLISDFSRVILLPTDRAFEGSLNGLYRQLSGEPLRFEDYFELNTELLAAVAELPIAQKVIFTTGKVQDAPEIADRVRAAFSRAFTVEEIGFDKTQPAAFLEVCRRLGVEPAAACFMDDTTANVEAAQQAGLAAEVFWDNAQILPILKQWAS